MKFKIGDRVLIRKDSEYYGKDKDHNPANVVGVVSYIFDDDDHPYWVDWSEEYANSYREYDLELEAELGIAF